MSKSYIENNKHINFKKNINRCGTLRYMSINIHNKYQPSRKDDLISLAYSLIYLYKKKLPWMDINYNKEDKDIKFLLVKKKKMKYNNDISFENILPPLLFLYRYSINLKFNSEPDYNFLIKGFYNYILLKGYRYDGEWSFK